MPHQRIARPVVTLLAATGSAALLTGGIAEAEGWGQSAPQTHRQHAVGAPATKAGHGACAAPKKSPVAGRRVTVSGHTVRVRLANSHRSTGAAAHKKKTPPPGMRVVSVNGHTVRAVPTGGQRATRPC